MGCIQIQTDVKQSLMRDTVEPSAKEINYMCNSFHCTADLLLYAAVPHKSQVKTLLEEKPT